ncbi:hypothetical protein RJT34_28703 [Clitoria ternatea]|uniref:Protein BIC1 n=1 Tax=Clitoria ternatea TaxID=43366 RepID=A0AAN9IAG0_CLITE
MEGNKLAHKIITSESPSILSLEQNGEKLMMSDTRECKPPNTEENEDKAKDIENNKVSDEIEEITGREMLKRFREEVKVKIPETWGQEELLKDWIDCTTMFDALLAPHTLILTARDALVANGRQARSQRLRI